MPHLPEDPRDLTNPFVIDTLDARLQESRPLPEVFRRTTPQPLIDPEVLEGYSLAFYEFVVRVRPEWRPALQFAASDESGTYLYLQLPSPSAVIANLWLSTEGEQVTVGLGELYHAHFATYPPATDAEMFVRALKFADDIVEEKLVLLTAMMGGLRGCSWVRLADETILIPDSFGLSQPTYNRVCVYSWKSTFDREVPV